MSLTKIVVPILDSQALDVSKFDHPEVFQGMIPGELPVPMTPPCFSGAWYRKVFSAKDHWIGIEGTIELGEFTPDENRFNLDGKGRYMDVPSIYMGGAAKKESDAGIGLNTSYETNDTSAKLTLSSKKIAYRPFWRYIYHEVSDIDGIVRRREVNSWNVSDPRHLGYYYFPGDVLRMKVYSPCEDYLQLRIEVVETTKNPKYVAIREQYQLPNHRPSDFYSPMFHSEGHGVMPAEFKRVNAIDQYGNEGHHVHQTDAHISKATWRETYLYREIAGRVVKVPFSEERQVSMICPYPDAFTVTKLDPKIGAESIIIDPRSVRFQR